MTNRFGVRIVGRIGRIAAAGAVLAGALGATCQRRIAIDEYPSGVLRVRFVQATRLTDCLLAGVVMCTNYVTASERFDPQRLRDVFAERGLDPTRTADVRAWLADEGIELTPLIGALSDEPQTGLGWWVARRGYPTMCVVNKFGGNADYNHAVVVIGFAGSGSAESASEVYVLDSSSPKRLEQWDRLTFEHYWASAGNIMLPLYEMPKSQPQQAIATGANP
ncbi:MAG: hypothetical protein GY778_11370 [bacterium]|nr:hypothetical protein [bacterium]